MKHHPPLHILDEHNEAFSVWHQAKAAGFIQGPLDLFHIDAHDDMGRPESFRRPLYAAGRSGADSLDFYRHFALEELHHGNFIIPAVLTGLVRNVYFIYPPWRKFKPRQKKHNVATAFGEGRVLKYDMKMEEHANPALFQKTLPDLKSYTYYMRELAHIPANRKVILDIDLDYFACRDSIANHFSYELEITAGQYGQQEDFLRDATLKFAGLDFAFLQRDGKFFVKVGHQKIKEASHLPPKEEISQEVKNLVDTLRAKRTRPAVISIARSCVSGYCPPDYVDFIEAELVQRLQTFIAS
jgi:hypothetical protein